MRSLQTNRRHRETHPRRQEEAGKGWVAKRGSKIVASGQKKTTTVRKAAKVARNARKPTSLRIHKRNGRFQEERTYRAPRIRAAQRAEPSTLPYTADGPRTRAIGLHGNGA